MFPINSTKTHPCALNFQLYTYLNTLNFAEKKTCWSNMQPLNNAFAFPHGFAKMHPCLHPLSQECVRVYTRCCENGSPLPVPFILDQSVPLKFTQKQKKSMCFCIRNSLFFSSLIFRESLTMAMMYKTI